MIPFEQACDPASSTDAPAREIVLQGFDAIPPLLELLRDNRLTAHRRESRARRTASCGSATWPQFC